MAYDRMMADMGMSMQAPWTATEVLVTFVMWSVMMVGMMAPSAAPVMMLFMAMQRDRGVAGTAAVTTFGAGYLLTWVMFSAAAALTQWALHEAAMLSPAMAMAAPVGALVLIAAGIYQLTPLKASCLTHCQSPLGFLMAHWREGPRGALGMGMRHGAYCVGCCWALMGVLFVVGVMNLLWVAALTVLVLLEKAVPRGTALARIGGVALILAGVLHLFVA